MFIYESKQVGPVSYMVEYLDVLQKIVETELIRSSTKPELNPVTRRKQKYVSLSRHLYSAGQRNAKRWKYGVILDGDKLSNKYNITPFSYAGATFNTGTSVRVKYIAAYDNNTYVLSLINWATFPISKQLYTKITNEIEAMPEDVKELKRLVHTGVGKVTRGGRKLIEKYLFDVPVGGLQISLKNYPEISSALLKSEGMNETEERIWLKDNSFTITIKNCITGLVLPKQLSEEEREYIRNEVKPLLSPSAQNNIVYY